MSSGDQVRAGRRRRRGGWRVLNSRRDFSRVYEDGVRRVGRLLVLYVYPGDDQARAVVASRKVGGAVARNRAKRLLRVAIRGIEDSPATAAQIRERLLPDAPRDGGLWVVAVARARIASACSRDVIAELEQLLDRPGEGSREPEPR